MLKVKVSNMGSSSSGNPVPNQFIIDTDEGVYFQSYNSVIAANIGGKTYLDERYWDCSKTTGRYRNQFLGENKSETERKIKDGTYQLVNLN